MVIVVVRSIIKCDMMKSMLLLSCDLLPLRISKKFSSSTIENIDTKFGGSSNLQVSPVRN